MAKHGEELLRGAVEQIEQTDVVLEHLGTMILAFASRAAEHGVSPEVKALYESVSPALRHLAATVTQMENEIVGQDIPLEATEEPVTPAEIVRPTDAGYASAVRKVLAQPVGKPFQAEAVGLDPEVLVARGAAINWALQDKLPNHVLVGVNETTDAHGYVSASTFAVAPIVVQSQA